MGATGMFTGDWTTPEMLSLLSKSDSIFTGLQQIDQTEPPQPEGPGVEVEQRYHRILSLYQAAIDEYRRTLPSDEAEIPFCISETLALVHLLYLPADGLGMGVVGEEVLRWLNVYDPRPTLAERNRVADVADPGSDPRYWDYLFQCVLRGLDQTAVGALNKFDTHPSPSFRTYIAATVRLLLGMPRSTKYAIEAEFAAQRKAWTGKVAAHLAALEVTLDQFEREVSIDSEERIAYEASLGCLLQILLGNQERILEASHDWRDAFGAWGLYVQPTMKRGDVPDVVALILDRFPSDPTNPMEQALTAFARGDALQGAQATRDIDPWLTVHLTDLLGRAGVLDQRELGARELLLSSIDAYATTVMEDQGLWRIAVAYLASTGDEGRKRMREILLSVPYNIAPPRSGSGMDVDPELEDGGDRFRRVEELLRACQEFQMTEEPRAICQGVAETLVNMGEFGQAVPYCVRAGNATLIRVVVNNMLDAYGESGPKEFLRLVEQFPQTWLVPGGGGESNAQYAHRLAFLGSYRDFHCLVADGDQAGAARALIFAFAARAPETFWAVLLIDAIPLLESTFCSSLFSMSRVMLKDLTMFLKRRTLCSQAATW